MLYFVVSFRPLGSLGKNARAIFEDKRQGLRTLLPHLRMPKAMYFLLAALHKVYAL